MPPFFPFHSFFFGYSRSCILRRQSPFTKIPRLVRDHNKVSARLPYSPTNSGGEDDTQFRQKKLFFLVPSRLFGSGPTTSFFSPDPTSASQRAKCAAETLVAPIWASHGGRRGFRHRSLCGCVSASPSHHTGHSRRGASKYCARRSTFPMLFALRSPPGLDWSG